MYTKGPWKVAEVEGKRLTCVYAEDTNIALLVHQEDAHLISAAPELLKALKRFKIFYLTLMAHNPPSAIELRKIIPNDIINKMEQAIAKAEPQERGKI